MDSSEPFGEYTEVIRRNLGVTTLFMSACWDTRHSVIATLSALTYSSSVHGMLSIGGCDFDL